MNPSMALCLLAAGVALRAQQFEVASVKPSAPERRGPPVTDLAPGGRFTAANASLRVLLRKAFDIRDFQITGEPEWIDSARFDIEARTENGLSIDEKQLKPPLQALLADRFKLLSRMESKELSVYALVAGNRSLRMAKAKTGENANGGVRLGGSGRLTGVAASMSQLAEMLSDVRFNGLPLIDRPVINETGLAGSWDFKLTWAPEGADLPESSIFTAVQDQLGLKLESRKSPIRMLIIEHVEKPSGN